MLTPFAKLKAPVSASHDVPTMVAAGGAPTASARRLVLAAAVVAFALTALFAPRGLVVVLGLGATLGLLAGEVRPGFDAAVRSPPLVPIGLLMLWAAIAIWWAPDPAEAIRSWHGLLWVALGALVALAQAHGLSSGARAGIERGVVAAGAAFAGILAIEVATDAIFMRGLRIAVYGDIYPADWSFLGHYLRPTAVLAIFAWPCALVLWRRYGAPLSLAFVVLAAGLAAFIGMNAAFVAMVIGAVVFAAVHWRPRATVPALLVVMVGAVMLAPLIVTAIADPGVARLPSSWVHRLAIWDFVAARIAESPWIGWGFDASKHLPGGAEPIVIRGIETVPLPSHPHNGSLQVWAELGAPGALLLAAVFAGAARAVRAPGLPRADTAARAAGLATFFVMFSLSYGAWQSWWMALAALIAALYVALSPPAGLAAQP